MPTALATPTAPPLEGSSFRGGHRVWKAKHGRPYDSFKPYGYGEGHALVTVTEWGISYEIGGDQGTKLNVHRIAFDGRTVERHELDGTVHASKAAASRVAWEAGLLGFMVYERATR